MAAMARPLSRPPRVLVALPDAVLVDHVGATWLPLANAAALFATCRRFAAVLAPQWRAATRRRWLATAALHPRERAAIDAGLWHARAVQAFLYRRHRARWTHHLVRDVRIPRPLLCHMSRWLPRGPTLSDVQFDMVEHVACDLWRRPCPSPVPVAPVIVAMGRDLPFVRLECGPWSLVGSVLYRDRRWIAGTVLARSRKDGAPGRLWPTAQFRPAAAAWLRSLAARPADGLMRYCTQCPFCGSARDARGTPTDPCAYQWAAWAARWAPWGNAVASETRRRRRHQPSAL